MTSLKWLCTVKRSHCTIGDRPGLSWLDIGWWFHTRTQSRRWTDRNIMFRGWCWLQDSKVNMKHRLRNARPHFKPMASRGSRHLLRHRCNTSSHWPSPHSRRLSLWVMKCCSLGVTSHWTPRVPDSLTVLHAFFGSWHTSTYHNVPLRVITWCHHQPSPLRSRLIDQQSTSHTSISTHL